MARKKVTLSFIPNEAERRASYKKRKKGLIKKVSELSTLCGVDACAIIYSPFEAEPTVWPSVEGAQAVLARLQRMSTIDQTRKMVNQETYTRQRIKKTDDQLRRLRRDSRLRQMENIMFSHMNGNPQNFNPADAADMGFVINQALREIKAKMAELRRKEKLLPPLPPPPAAAAAAPEVPMGMSLDYAGVGEEAMGMGFDFVGLQEEALPQRSAEDLEGFPWNLVESPAFRGLDDGLGWDDDGLAGWDDDKAWPWQCPSYFFDDGAGPSGAK